MKDFAVRTLLFAACCLPFAGPASAEPFAFSASTTILWSSLRVETDPGVTISWLASPKTTSLVEFSTPAFYSSCCADGASMVSQSIDSWGNIFYSSQLGGPTTSGLATGSALSADVAWSQPPPGDGGPVLSNQIMVTREGAFVVAGSGNVTFSLDYGSAANRSIDPSSLPYEFIETAAFSAVEMLLYSPFVTCCGGSDLQLTTLPIVTGAVHDSFSEAGTATMQRTVSDGNTYRLRTSAFSMVTVRAPEPSSFILLGVGLAGLIALGYLRNTKQADGDCVADF
jgi:hypothetical protein